MIGNLKRYFFVYFFLTIIIVTMLGAFAEDTGDLSSNNTTNITTNNTTDNNDSNLTEDVTEPDVETVGPLAIIIFSFSIDPNNVNFGNLVANNAETSITGATQVSVSALGTTYLYVRASGDLINTANSSQTISLSNLKYDGFGNSTLTKRSFTTTDSLVRVWRGLFVSDTVSVNYYLTIPYGTDPGTYSTTIYYTAV